MSKPVADKVGIFVGKFPHWSSKRAFINLYNLPFPVNNQNYGKPKFYRKYLRSKIDYLNWN